MPAETLPCGCVRTENLGHVHTKLCDRHKRELFEPKPPAPYRGRNDDLL